VQDNPPERPPNRAPVHPASGGDSAGDEPLRLPASVWTAIRADADRGAPDECCGLLIGEGRRIDAARPAGNVALIPAVRYEIDPRDHFDAIRHARTLGLSVIGAYHSHPRSSPVPSPSDRAEAHAGFVYLIAGRSDGEGWTARAFELIDGNFVERTLVIEA
jgi:desampylase